MDSLPADPVILVARDPARGIDRYWGVAAGRDLFGRIVVETRWGRGGRGGQHRLYSFADEAAALTHVHRLLTRRASAPRRIGIA